MYYVMVRNIPTPLEKQLALHRDPEYMAWTPASDPMPSYSEADNLRLELLKEELDWGIADLFRYKVAYISEN